MIHTVEDDIFCHMLKNYITQNSSHVFHIRISSLGALDDDSANILMSRQKSNARRVLCYIKE